ncbi:histidinol dehydrogenase [Edwardsiella ictaluri]|uniref:Histidinol dehydrogenase n=1 Tax=Edwardsiella ictaluri (strain 93-146) TaxID=634503 RepID=C5BG11_EDWI9|nr:histidinol dehydrogenase [Edwardsiella ictaluri]ACR69734.1 histidinol dehydrogenase, putative [Edwardsiella ictaluri 93-146]AVZ83301.1 histidinol dehydrogenase [Edwardsiella ictaluri]EKS7761822.1 histidinol dehydrogenase [Edwardsiella ictaluri]EKS7768632.1 histidinol dehydrogenase [Edwardsiella ictaluri]EKS7772050.1 histidinol dehydrogenase [Edwardsiella ictaluri]
MIRFDTLIQWDDCSPEQQHCLLQRPAIASAAQISANVEAIIAQVRHDGDAALHRLSQRFDREAPAILRVSRQIRDVAGDSLPDALTRAMGQAAKNIEVFHRAQCPAPVEVETQPGVCCRQISRALDTVGLYIPGGSAPLLSTVLMLGIPARVAQCRRVILCSPPPIDPAILYAARLCGIDEIFQVGGAQAIAAMAFGTESVPRVDKIFGPGNAYVTEAKRQVSQSPRGAAIDMPAGPSEVLVIADSGANPEFIAADLLSQAEHGPDSQVLLLTPDAPLARRVAERVKAQLALLPRADIARQALAQSRLIVTRSLAQCIEISNRYGPEHLIIQTRDAEAWLDAITSAGSVFLGDWSPESAGDYASGTNHVLPTYGYTATHSSLGLADFQKRMTVQRLSPAGLLTLAPTVEAMAQAECLDAHANAVRLRVAAIRESQS